MVLMSPAYDLVIRSGTVADGTGGDLFEADVAIEGDRFVAVGRGLAAGAEEIDATGLLVTPGFVDVHTHYDGQVTRSSTCPRPPIMESRPSSRATAASGLHRAGRPTATSWSR
jgi:N-acyl-D-aspartate/D-glutamate deacylase